MSETHLTRKRVRELLAGEGSIGDFVATAVVHLEATCPRCRAELAALRREGLAPAAGVPAGEAAEEYAAAYRQALSRAIDYQDRHRRERRSARRRLDALLALPADERSAAAGRERRFADPAVAELLLAESRERLADEPGEAHALARLAREVLQPCAPNAAVVELYARALAYMAGARRLEGEPHAAEELFAHARFLLRTHGDVDPGVVAEIDRLAGSLGRDPHRPEPPAAPTRSTARRAAPPLRSPLGPARGCSAADSIGARCADPPRSWRF